MRKSNQRINIRVSEHDKNRLQWLADKYADGNLTKFLVYSALNAPRRKIGKGPRKKDLYSGISINCR